MFIILFVIPRVFGLTAASCNVRTCQVIKSKLWRVYSIVCGCCFLIAYPFAITAILTHITLTSESNIFIYIDITNYAATYLFCVAIYLRVMMSTEKLTQSNNLHFTVFDECRALCKQRKDVTFFLYFTNRAFYLYVGNAILNTIKLVENSERLVGVPFIYKILYFLPDMIMASTIIRFRTAVTMYTMCCEQINQVLSECIGRIKSTKCKPLNARFRAVAHVSHTFDKVTERHCKLYSLVKSTETLSGNLLLFSILRTFAHLSSTVILIYI